jgi:lipoyl(octanoyl) transferase
MKKLRIIDLDTMDYNSAGDIMSEVRDEVEHGADDTLILLEHNPVITIGSDGNEYSVIDTSYIKEQGIPVIHTDRGGGAVVHNNGQLVGYPVMKLSNMPLDLLSGIVEIMADAVSEFNVKPKKGEEPGLWVADRKICFVGMKIHNKVTTHGFAINISNDLTLFKAIKTCGVENEKITNLTLSTKKMVSMDMVKHVVISKFSRRFDYLPDKFILRGSIS